MTDLLRAGAALLAGRLSSSTGGDPGMVFDADDAAVEARRGGTVTFDRRAVEAFEAALTAAREADPEAHRRAQLMGAVMAENAARDAMLGRSVVGVEHVVDQRGAGDSLRLFFDGGGALVLAAERLRFAYDPHAVPDGE